MKFEALTIKDIAKALGLSTSTVSRALRDSYEISPETKKLVLEYAETEKSIAKTLEIMKQKDMAKIMQPTLDILKKTLEDYKQPDNKYIESFYQYEIRENEDRKRSYQERLARWEKDFPADFNVKVKERLQKFLALSATVDFNAELKQVGNKKKFVNPAYESKSYDWKQIYRAGKDVIDPARMFAEKWLSEL